VIPDATLGEILAAGEMATSRPWFAHNTDDALLAAIDAATGKDGAK